MGIKFSFEAFTRIQRYDKSVEKTNLFKIFAVIIFDVVLFISS